MPPSSPQLDIPPEEYEKRLQVLPLSKAEIHLIEWVKALHLHQLQHERNAQARHLEMDKRLEFVGKTAQNTEAEVQCARRDISDLKATTGELAEGVGALIRHHEESVKLDAEQTAKLQNQADQIVKVEEKLTAISILKWTVGGGSFLGVMAVVQRVIEWLLKSILGG